MLALLGLSFGGVAFAVRASTGRRTLANAVAGGLAVITFIVQAVGPTVDWVRPFRPLSPFRWYQDPGCSRAACIRRTSSCCPASIVSYGIACITFDRRDLSS